MARCTAIKADGERCQGVAIEGSEWCYQHDPANAEERQRNARRGGRSGGRGRVGVSEAAQIRKELKELVSNVQDGSVDRRDAAILVQIANARTRLCEVEMKVREHTELTERIARLEEAANSANRGGRSWGA